MNSTFTKLEAMVLEAILQGAPEYASGLQQQLETVPLDSRNINGYGFYTVFANRPDVPTIDFSGRLHASAEVSDEHCRFILWIKAGRVDFLEGYPLVADSWPNEETIRKVRFENVDADSIH